MRPIPLACSALSFRGLVHGVPLGGSLRNLNQEICTRAGTCGHHMDCTELWLSCNLGLFLEGKVGFSEDGEHPDLGYMVPWWYQGIGVTM